MTPTSLPVSVQESINAKIAGIVSQRIAWQQACSRALAAKCSVSDLVKLVDALESWRSLEVMARLSKRFEEPLELFFQSMRQRVDESSFGEADWIRSLEVVFLELDNTQRVASLETVLGFVHCTAEFVAGQRLGQPLPSVVVEMLEQYGFDG